MTVLNADYSHYFNLTDYLKLDTKTNVGFDTSRVSFCTTVAFDWYREVCSVPYGTAQPCGKDKVGKIYRALKKFFIVLRGVKKYLDKYVNQTINAVQNLQSEIKATITEIAAVLKTIVHRAREWVLKKVKKGIENLITKALPPQGQEPKKALLNRIIDEIFCKFDEIIKGLFNLVGDFLYSLIGKIINIPFCAVENFVNALINKVLTDIDNALGPIFNKINKALAPVTKIMGSVFQAIDYILGFEGFLCEQPDCNDELKEFAAGPWGKPQNSKTDNWSNFSFSSSIGKGASKLMDDFFGKGKNGNYVSPGGCNSGPYNCGVQVDFFGGGGSGAVGAAVVNKIGQVVGVNLFYGGNNYQSPPFVTFVDPGGCGSGASGQTEISGGQVIGVDVDTLGIGYTDPDKFKKPVVSLFKADPNPINVNNALTFSWETDGNYVSLGIPGYTNLPATGKQAININETDILFPAGSNSVDKKYTLTATNTYPDGPNQDTIVNLNVTIQKTDAALSTPSTPPTPPTPPSALSPSILSFIAEPSTATLNSVVKFIWQTSDATSVGLGISDPTGSGKITPIYSKLITNGSASLVLPDKLDFPADGSNIINYYVLTAENKYAPTGKQTDQKVTEVVIIPPKFIAKNIKTKITDEYQKISGGNISGTVNQVGQNSENTSGSIIPTTGKTPIVIEQGGGGGGTPQGGGGGTPQGGDENTGGGGDTGPTTFPSSTSGSQTVGGAIVDPSSGGGSTDSFTSGGGFTTIPSIGIGTISPATGGEVTGTTTQTGQGTTAAVPITPGVATGSNVSNVISEISNIKIINTGSGYSPNDTVEIVGGNNNADLKIEVSPTGQIVNIDIISGGYGFVTIPEIRINSDTGTGAQFRVRLGFVPASKFTEKELTIIGTEKLLKVIDCVIK